MKLIQRVLTLLRANLNELLDQAEDPEVMIKQLLADLERSLIQVKTAAARSLADRHLLERKLEGGLNEIATAERQAELALRKGNERLARTALEQANSWRRSVEILEVQLSEQRKQSESLKSTLTQIEIKVAEAKRQRDVYLARYRRATVSEQLNCAGPELSGTGVEEMVASIENYINHAEARALGADEVQLTMATSSSANLTQLEADDLVDRQLAVLRERIDSSSRKVLPEQLGDA